MVSSPKTIVLGHKLFDWPSSPLLAGGNLPLDEIAALASFLRTTVIGQSPEPGQRPVAPSPDNFVESGALPRVAIAIADANPLRRLDFRFCFQQSD